MSTFQIQQFTRVHDDPCDQAVQNRESAGPGAYHVTSLLPGVSTAVTAAYAQPVVSISTGYGWSAANIDADSVLRNHSMQTNSPQCPLRGRAQARPFMTVPFMGRGRGDADIESRLTMPELVRTGKDCGTMSETFYAGQFTPLIPYVAANIQNPVHLIPEVASAGWVRAGVPSRQWVRDLNC